MEDCHDEENADNKETTKQGCDGGGDPEQTDSDDDENPKSLDKKELSTSTTMTHSQETHKEEEDALEKKSCEEEVDDDNTEKRQEEPQTNSQESSSFAHATNNPEEEGPTAHSPNPHPPSPQTQTDASSHAYTDSGPVDEDRPPPQPGAVHVPGLNSPADQDTPETESPQQPEMMGPGAYRYYADGSGDDTSFTTFPSIHTGLPSEIPQAPPVLDGFREETPDMVPDEDVVPEPTGLRGFIATYLRLIMIGWIVLLVLLIGAATAVGIIVSNNNNDPVKMTVPPTGTPTSAPTTVRHHDVLQIVSKLTNNTILEDPTTPQHAAFEWLVKNDTWTFVSESKLLQRYALATLFFATNGTSWTIASNFLTERNECEWQEIQISCNTDGFVEEIRLGEKNLQGTIPHEISAFSSLRILSLFWNRLTGTIPSSMFSLTNLEELQLYRNQLSGTLTSMVSELTVLERLEIGFNQLSGSLPPSIGKLSVLRNLLMETNRFTGSVPSEVGDLVTLSTWRAFRNKLSGQIPSTVANMVSLQRVDLSLNEFTGTMDVFCGVPGLEGDAGILQADCLESAAISTSEVVCTCCSHCCLGQSSGSEELDCLRKSE